MNREPHLVTAEAEHPIREAIRYVAITFLIAGAVYLPLFASDRGWIDITLPPLLAILGVLSPGIATIVIHLYDDGLDSIRSDFGGLKAWQFGRVWWGVTLAMPPALLLAYLGAIIGFGHEFSPKLGQMGAEAGGVFVLLILLTVVTAVGEEIGWRGHLLPLLQARMSALTASLVLGGIWAVWHVPLFLGFEGLALPLRIISVFGGAVMFTWLFNNTGGSVLAVTLLHFGNNFWARLAGLFGAPGPTDTPAAAAFMLVNILLAVVLIVVFGGATLTEFRGLAVR